MSGNTMEQARTIFEAARALQKRIMGRKCRFGSSDKDFCHSLTMPQVNMLSVIRSFDGASLKDLANSLGVSAPSASSMVDRLVEMGAITREQNPDDRREVIVRVSAQTAEILDQIEADILHGIVEYLEKLGPEYAEKWCDVYERLLDIMARDEE
ncbi:MAG: MarR family transcriptional regulator [Candidatus Hydrogenedentes bacterium]|nr:MarR family transcriptional regulator [Candidatus Hydrogenedentota bacterium]